MPRYIYIPIYTMFLKHDMFQTFRHRNWVMLHIGCWLFLALVNLSTQLVFRLTVVEPMGQVSLGGLIADIGALGQSGGQTTDGKLIEAVGKIMW